MDLHKLLGAGVVGLCVYETVALTTSRLPTASALCRRDRRIEALLLAILLAHLHYKLAEVEQLEQQIEDMT